MVIIRCCSLRYIVLIPCTLIEQLSPHTCHYTWVVLCTVGHQYMLEPTIWQTCTVRCSNLLAVGELSAVWDDSYCSYKDLCPLVRGSNIIPANLIGNFIHLHFELHACTVYCFLLWKLELWFQCKGNCLGMNKEELPTSNSHLSVFILEQKHHSNACICMMCICKIGVWIGI